MNECCCGAKTEASNNLVPLSFTNEMNIQTDIKIKFRCITVENPLFIAVSF